MQGLFSILMYTKSKKWIQVKFTTFFTVVYLEARITFKVWSREEQYYYEHDKLFVKPYKMCAISPCDWSAALVCDRPID